MHKKLQFCCITFLLGVVAGCSSTPTITKKPVPIAIDTSAAVLRNIRSWLGVQSSVARSLNVDGDITVDQAGETNSASFTMKSKRIDPKGDRIDSLSIEVSGPFGIKVARLLASPQRYQFYDVLHGETMSGATNAESLEALTHMRGISLTTMSDIIYGLPGVSLDGDSIRLYSNSDSRHIIIVQDRESNVSTLLDFEGMPPSDSTRGNLMLDRVEEWNGIIDPIQNTVRPLVSAQFSEPELIGGVTIPKHIEAIAGENKLILQYDKVDLNPYSLTVKIKMPQ